MPTVKIYDAIPISVNEILRYAGVKRSDETILSLLESALSEAEHAPTYKVCYTKTNLCVEDGICDFGFFKTESHSLAKNLFGCKRAIIFAATVGVAIDRLIAKYSRVYPSKALMLNAFGTERVEALCDRFCADIEICENIKLRPRFSPGYGDAPLDMQKDIFKLLCLPTKIGISLNESMLMSPSKSVTAIVGIEE